MWSDCAHELGARTRTITDDLDVLAELSSFTLDLDTVMEELLEVSSVEDTVGGGLRVVDDEFVLGGSTLGGGDFGGLWNGHQPTEKVTQQSVVPGTDHCGKEGCLEAGCGIREGLAHCVILCRLYSTK